MPTRMQLIDKGVTYPTNNWGLCSKGVENNKHLLLHYPKSIECWEKVRLWYML